LPDGRLIFETKLLKNKLAALSFTKYVNFLLRNMENKGLAADSNFF